MKTKLGPHNALYPMPTVLVGAMVNGKPNFITIAHLGIMDLGTISISVNQQHYSCVGIKESKAFSLNIPSTDMVTEVDYCGIVSGERMDKASLFDVFIGDDSGAPMISKCPVNMECELLKTFDFHEHDVYIGKIVQTHCDESILENGTIVPSKLDPILFFMDDRSYHGLGGKLASAWKIGEKLIDA
ncbi:MAG: flavin reductase family protein [Kiritimatiellaeota bacterium]|nr:flavin reductase family protein [Kiritimatiellota bacterium]